MKIREITSGNSGAPKKPTAAPDHQFLFDKNLGLMAGIEIDEEDQPKGTPTNRYNVPSDVPFTNNTIGDGPEWVRQMMPSLCVPYNQDNTSLTVKPLEVPMLAAVHASQATAATNQQKGFTMLVDALAPTLNNFDIRNLTVPDWYSHIYWLRLNSYPRSPYNITWTSRYGNENVSRVTTSSFEFEELAMSRQEYRRWNSEGISFPTVRDMEALFDPDLSEETRFTIRYAQYIYDENPDASFMKRKVAKLGKLGMDAISMINEFSKLVSHGVVEQIKVKDSHFSLDKAIAFIEEEILTTSRALDIAVDALKEDDATQSNKLINFALYIENRKEEVLKLIHVRDNGGIDPSGRMFEPEMEVVPLAPATSAFLFP